MARIGRSSSFALAVLALLVSAPAAAAEPIVVTLRVSSLTALETAGAQLAQAGQPGLSDWLTGSDSLPFGITGSKWVDRTRPLVAVLPQNGVMAASQAWVLAVPVTDARGLAAWVAERYPAAVEEGGVRKLPVDGGEAFLRSTGDYAAFGYTRVFVERFDPAAALATDDLPPGPIAVEVQLEPLVPLVQMGLAQGRAMLEQGAPEGDPVPGMEGLELYLDLLNDLLLNVSRLQVSLGVEGGSLKIVKRLIPRSDSTLAGLLAAQPGGLPDLARHVDPQGAAVVSVAQIEMTPAFRAALEAYMQRYAAMMQSVASSLDPDATPGITTWMSQMGSATAQALDCNGGSWVQVMHLEAAGMRTAALGNVIDAERCEAALSALGAVATPEGEAPILEFEKDVFVHAGVRASRQTTRLPVGVVDEAQREVMERLLGEGAVTTTYYGFLGKLMLSSGGRDAEQGFRALVDRASGKTSGAGIEAALFAPLTPGASFLVRADLGALGAFVSAEEREEGAAPTLAGTVLGGVHLSPEAATIELLLPLSVIAAARPPAEPQAP